MTTYITHKLLHAIGVCFVVSFVSFFLLFYTADPASTLLPENADDTDIALFKKQYGLDSIHLILTNLYGPGDSYNPDRSHVVAALVRKWVEADLAGAKEVEVWGTGKPIREFIYVEDCADAIVLAAEVYNDEALPLNIGTGIGTTIKELAETVHDLSGFRGTLRWNADKPDGAAKKVLDVTRMKEVLDGWTPPTAGHRLAGGQPRRWRGVPSRSRCGQLALPGWWCSPPGRAARR